MDQSPTPIPVSEPKNTAPQSVHRNASWGALISITIILAMVIIGAFYAWGQRISENRAAQAQLQSST